MSGSRIPRVVWILGLVSLCMDLSSEMIHALLPVYLVVQLGASAAAVGLIEGIAECTASFAKVFSGRLSDSMRQRKPLVLLGYGLAALSKPLFPLADSAVGVLAARFLDRVGKGIRGAPRDALLADATPSELRGAAFGLRQSLDTAGALLGPLAALALMIRFAGDVRAVFWCATAPAFLAVAVLAFGVEEPSQHGDQKLQPTPPTWRAMRQMPSTFWIVVSIGTVFALARFSEAFLLLRAKEAGLALSWTPLALAVMNLTYVLSAYPAGRLSDQVGRVGLLMIGMITLIVSDVILAAAPSQSAVFVGIAIWGLHMGLTQGLLSAMVADTAPAELRGSAFGVFYFVTGIASLVASIVAGKLWDVRGSSFTFSLGAVLSAVALGGLACWRHRFVRNV